MTIKYGFELEGFFCREGNVCIPPTTFPHDDFPGLVEARTTGGNSLEAAYSNLLQEIWRIDGLSPDDKYGGVDYRKTRHKFTPEQRREMRRNGSWNKDAIDIQNLYGKKPRALGNTTIASFQISMSNIVKEEHYDQTGYSNDGRHTHKVWIPDQIGLLDTGRIVRNLDKEFMKDILASGRQPGEYAIKGNRLEYRSLPNAVICFDRHMIPCFLNRIKKAVEE